MRDLSSKQKMVLCVMVHTFTPSTQEAETGRSLISVCSGPAWSTELVLRQPGIHRETLSQREGEGEGEGEGDGEGEPSYLLSIVTLW